MTGPLDGDMPPWITAAAEDVLAFVNRAMDRSQREYGGAIAKDRAYAEAVDRWAANAE